MQHEIFTLIVGSLMDADMLFRCVFVDSLLNFFILLKGFYLHVLCMSNRECIITLIRIIRYSKGRKLGRGNNYELTFFNISWKFSCIGFKLFMIQYF